MFAYRLPRGIWVALALVVACSAFGLRRAASHNAVLTPTIPAEDHPGQIFTVNNTNDAGPGSLRQAILDANATPGADTVVFSLGGSGLQRIALTAPLPEVTGALTLDAVPAGGAGPVPVVEINGTEAGANADGLTISAGNTFILGLRIAGFSGNGLVFRAGNSNAVRGCVIQGNKNGVVLEDTSGNSIGHESAAGQTQAGGNLIGGNREAGVSLSGASQFSNFIYGNVIGVGLDTNGNRTPLGNQAEGLLLNGATNIRLSNNQIVNNGAHGIRLVNTNNAEVYGNLIGTHGNTSAGNGGFGVLLTNSANCVIGGADATQRNVISANITGLVIEGSGSANNTVQNNYIGANASGTASLGNIFDGVALRQGAHSNLIGSQINANEGNLIAGNVRYAVYLFQSGGSNFVRRNKIGVNAAGNAPLPNGNTGVRVEASSQNNIWENTIANGNNSGFGAPFVITPGDLTLAHGVAISNGGTRNSVSRNSIYANLGQAIFLDTANNNQAAPQIISAAIAFGLGNGDLEINGALDSAANRTFTVELFDSADCDEAEHFLASQNITTDANGHAAFTARSQLNIAPGRKITATATDENGNTSAISPCREVVPKALVAINANDSGPGSLRQLILQANSQPGRQFIRFNVPGPAPHIINLLSPLPEITESLVIDGHSRPDGILAPAINLPRIGLNGANAGNTDGLVLRADNCGVASLSITNFSGSGIRVMSSGNVLNFNFVGVEPSGTVARGNANGIVIEAGRDNELQSNLIAGNSGAGVLVNAANNNLFNNLIGVTQSVAATLPNGGDGVSVTAANARIAGNIIGGNAGAGLRLAGIGQTFNARVQGNTIGGGGALFSNNGGGVVVSRANGNLIGADNFGSGNTIAYNSGPGVTVDGSVSNRILDNFIFSNTGAGIALINGGNNNQPAPALDVVVTTNTGTRAQGVLNAAPNASYRLQLFSNEACGQGEHLAGEATVTTNSSGAAVFNAPVTPAVPAGQFMTATATDANGNTSAFSNCKQIVTSQTATTPAGPNVLVNLGDVSVIFARVDTAGATTLTPQSASLTGSLPNGYSLTNNSLAFDLTTTANISGPVVVCLNTPAVNDVFAFARQRLLRDENGAATERTVLAPGDPAPNFAARRVCARVSGFNPSNPFVLADFATLNLTGRVINQSGAGVPGVLIAANSTAQPATTDADGRYILTNLAAGNYTLNPSQAGGAFTPATQVVNVSADTVAPAFLITPLPSTTAISGRVTDANGAGLSNVTVSLTGLGGVSTRTANSNGDYVFNGLVNGNYTATPARAGYTFTPAQRAINNLNGDVTGVNFTGVFVPNPTPTPTPDDNFGGPQIDRERWNLGVSSLGTVNFDPRVIVTQGSMGGVLLIQPRSGVDGQSFSGYVSAIPLDLTQTPIIGVQAVAPATGANAGTAFSVGRDSDNFARFLVTAAPQQAGAQLAAPTEGGMMMLVVQANFNGVNNTISIPYDPVQHLYWRFRYDAVSQTIYLETSPDATVWTVRLSRSLPPAGVQGLVAEIASGTFGSTINPGPATFDNYNVAPPIGFQLSAGSYSRSESGGAVTITIVRTGTTDNPASVNYATADGTARAGEDYTATNGTLVFGSGETSQTFAININSDTVLETDETVNIALSNPVGSRLNERANATLTIIDDDSGANPIDGAEFFTRQQYRDFLGREPDTAGLNYWMGQINSCGADLACLSRRRVEVSAAFFIELEFQNTGSFVAQMYRASYGRAPAFAEFTPDLSRLAGAANPDAARNALAADWVRRPAFAARFDSMAANAYVDALFAAAGVAPAPDERANLILGLATQTMTRAQVLLRVVDNAQFKQREYNRVFVLMQFFGYLQRDPDTAGFNFWLGVLNQQPQNFRGMVCAFVTSEEYQRRFSPVVTRNNGECQ